MRAAQRGHCLLDGGFRTDGFQTPLADFFAAPFLAHGWPRRLGSEKGPGAGQSETALAVLADVSSPGGIERIGYPFQVRVRVADDQRVLSGARAAAQVLLAS